jgi:P27 family predicted phage terminase small subunit
MRGRKPKPTEVKRRAGNPGKRKLNDAEPQFTAAIATQPPPFLATAAKEVWAVLAVELERSGVLKAVDLGTLAMYCQAYARWKDAEAAIASAGILTTNDKGVEIVNPAVRVSDMSVKQMVRLASELGITPASRSKVKADAPAKGKSLAELLSGDGEEESE